MTIRKLLAHRVADDDVQALVAKLKEHILASGCDPECMILFGSAARGEFTDQSDLDILIIFKDNDSLKLGKKAYFRKPFSTKVMVDAVFVTEDEYIKRSRIGGVCFVAAKEGKCIYDGRAHG